MRLVSPLVPRDQRTDWVEEWLAELAAGQGSMTHAWGALADAWYLRTEGWTVDAMWRDVRTAVRGFARRPAFALLAGVTLAIGIGANTAIFSVVDSVLLNPLPFPDAERLVSYNHTAPGLGVPLFPQSEATYLHYEENANALESFAVFTQREVNLVGEGDPRRLAAMQATEHFFEVMGIQPFVGRGFAAGEDRIGADPVVVLSYPFWEQSMGADPEAVGKAVEIDGIMRRVIGVMPRGAQLGSEQLWLPLEIDDTDLEVGNFGMVGVGRMAAGADIASVNLEMQRLLLRFAEEQPDDFGADVIAQAGLRADVKPLKELYVEGVRQALWVLLGTVGFVLLIACANVANLFLVRAEARQRERAVRTAMGASRLDMVRQYLTESVVLAAGAGVVGLGLAMLGVRGLLALAPLELPRTLAVGIDGSVLAFTAVISLGSGLLFGLLPILGYGRTNLTSQLKEGGRASTSGRERHQARGALVVMQVALALVLLVGSGLMARSFAALRNVDLGFEPAGRLTFRVGLPTSEYPTSDAASAFWRRLEERVGGIPGVLAVGATSGVPLEEYKNAGPMEPVDRPFPEGEIGPLIDMRYVTPGYFDAIGTGIVAGRALTWDDGGDRFRGVVISQALANSFWPGASAVGKQIRSQGEENEPWEVIGVAEDARIGEVEEEPVKLVYLPTVRGADTGPVSAADVVVRTASEPMAALDGVRQALRDIDARLPLVNPRTVESVVDESMASTSFTVVMLGIAAAVALLLGTVGIYGVISYTVGRRTQEIGVRMALGAQSGLVLRAVVVQGLRLTALGIALGLVGAWLMSQALESLLYGVTATDPVTFAAMALALTGVATLASWIPARRASRVDPVEALRAD